MQPALCANSREEGSCQKPCKRRGTCWLEQVEAVFNTVKIVSRNIFFQKTSLNLEVIRGSVFPEHDYLKIFFEGANRLSGLRDLLRHDGYSGIEVGESLAASVLERVLKSSFFVSIFMDTGQWFVFCIFENSKISKTNPR